MRRTRVSEILDLPVTERLSGETKQAWVYRSVSRLILSGTLRKGDRLPASRALATSWGVSRGIVELAFEQLVLEGYVASQVGRGTEVIANLTASAPKVSAQQTVRVTQNSVNEYNDEGASAQVEATQSTAPVANARLVDTSLFTIRVWQKHLNSVMKELTPALLAANDAKGYEGLRHVISRYLRMTRGIQCSTAQIIVTTGIRHAIDLISKAVVKRNTPCYIEDPGYKMLVPLLSYVTDKLIYVPLDNEGFSVDAIGTHCQPGLAFVTPAHQAPVGITMSINRRSELLNWAAQCNMWVVEDDYDSEFSYGSAPLPALKAIDQHDRVIHCGSFNKSLFPSLRIGYMVLPMALTERVATVRSETGRSNSIIEQITLTRFIEAGDFARHLRASRAVYMRRRDILLSALRNAFSRQIVISGEHAGFHFVLWLPAHADERLIVDDVLRHGVHVEGLEAFSRITHMPPAMVIGYANLDQAQVLKAASVIVKALRGVYGKTAQLT